MRLKRVAGWARDIKVVRPKLEKKWGLLSDELPGLLKTVPTNSFGPVKFGCQVIKKKKSLVEEVKALQNTVTDEKVR